LKAKTFFYKNDDTFYKISSGKIVPHSMDSEGHIGNVSNEIWKRRADIYKYDLDGLIFTPLLKGYFNKDIFKWKPIDTVDLYIEKVSTTQWKLFIAGISANNVYSNIAFSGIDGKGTFIVKKGRLEERIKNKIFTDTSIPEPLRNGVITVGKQTGIKFKDKCVIEFKYDKLKNTFIPMKERTDKVLSNGIPTINDIWNSFKEPISITNIRTSKFRSCIRPFHNEIKKTLIKQFTRGARVLDIGFGAGGDIHKYTIAGTKSVVGIDIVDKKYPLPPNMSFIKVVGDMYNLREILSKKNAIVSFDVVNIQFAVHYFFRNNEVFSNFFKNIDNALVKDGIIIMTLLDGNKVKTLLGKKTKKIGKCGKQKIYELEQTKNLNQASNFGQKLQVKLAGTAYFEEPSNEYLVNIISFLKHMTTNGYTIVKNASFSTYETQLKSFSKLMCSEEKEYSFLNNVVILKKN
jgi:SAM-dependent methyltransferase